MLMGGSGVRPWPLPIARGVSRGGPPRHPLRDDDDRRFRGGACDRRAEAGRARRDQPPGSARDEDPTAAMTAPFGGRAGEGTESRASGGYRVFSLLDEEGPEPEPGQFYMLAAERRWEER